MLSLRSNFLEIIEVAKNIWGQLFQSDRFTMQYLLRFYDVNLNSYKVLSAESYTKYCTTLDDSVII